MLQFPEVMNVLTVGLLIVSAFWPEEVQAKLGPRAVGG